MPVFEHSDQRGKYYQYGTTGKRYYVADWGEGMARRKAEQQAAAIHDAGLEEKAKGNFNPVNRVEVGFDPFKGKYYRWGFFGTKYYVNQFGEQRARSLSRRDGASERRRPYG